MIIQFQTLLFQVVQGVQLFFSFSHIQGVKQEHLTKLYNTYMNHNWYKLQLNCITNIIKESRYQASSDQLDLMNHERGRFLECLNLLNFCTSFFLFEHKIIPDGNFRLPKYTTQKMARLPRNGHWGQLHMMHPKSITHRVMLVSITCKRVQKCHIFLIIVCFFKSGVITWTTKMYSFFGAKWSAISSITTTWTDFFDKRDLVSKHTVLCETYGTSAMIRTGQPVSSSPPVRFVLRVHGLPGKSLVASCCCHSTHLLGWPTTQNAIAITRIINLYT